MATNPALTTSKEPSRSIKITSIDGLFLRPKRRRVQQRVNTPTVSLGVRRLYRFQETIRLLGKLPGKNMWFSENQRVLRILTATHLKIIVGLKEYKDSQLELYQLIDSEDFSMITFLIWVTSRQQGKTTALAQ